MKATNKRSELAVAAVCLAAGVLFFLSLDRLWPLASVDLVTNPHALRAQAAQSLEAAGFDLEGYDSAAEIVSRTPALDYVEREFGRERAQEWIASGLPLVHARVQFKKRGEPTSYEVNLHPKAGLLGWREHVEDDRPGARLDAGEARRLAIGALTNNLKLDAALHRERSAWTVERTARRDHGFTFERTLSEAPELRERIEVTLAGDTVSAAQRSLVVPPAAKREERANEAPSIVVETLGFALLAIGALGAFVVFLKSLRDGTGRLARAAVLPAAVFVCLLATHALQTADLFDNWEPLWPRWVSNLRSLVFAAVGDSWLLVVLLAVTGAADALDRKIAAGGTTRGESLWALAKGRFLDPSVSRASGRGFLIGLLCGGMMTAAVLALQTFAGAESAIQPRGFFFYILNSSSPAVTSLLFFFGVALSEELGYRYFGGTWLLALTGRRWVAVLVPAVIYGLTHARMDFLPPAAPFWARPLVLTLVGCVWGWTFLRYGALTVVLSHFTADLFIFNWPRLASGEVGAVVPSVLAIAAPLVPALLGLLRSGRVRPGEGCARNGS